MSDKKKKATAKVRTRVVAATDNETPVVKERVNKAKKQEVAKEKKPAKTKKDRDNYFTGAWHELKQVRWPDRKATWGMTFAVIVFTIFFVIMILLLDAGFKYLFDVMLKR